MNGGGGEGEAEPNAMRRFLRASEQARGAAAASFTPSVRTLSSSPTTETASSAAAATAAVAVERAKALCDGVLEGMRRRAGRGRERRRRGRTGNRRNRKRGERGRNGQPKGKGKDWNAHAVAAVSLALPSR